MLCVTSLASRNRFFPSAAHYTFKGGNQIWCPKPAKFPYLHKKSKLTVESGGPRDATTFKWHIAHSSSTWNSWLISLNFASLPSSMGGTGPCQRITHFHIFCLVSGGYHYCFWIPNNAIAAFPKYGKGPTINSSHSPRMWGKEDNEEFSGRVINQLCILGNSMCCHSS